MRRRAKATLIASFAFAFALALSTSPALAIDQTYVPIGSFSEEGTGDGQMIHPRRIAVESSSGNVFVVDRDNDRVQVFEPSGNSASYLTQFGAGILEAPFGVAIDQASGDVYVTDAGNDRIVKFNSDGAPVPSFSVDGTFTSPAKGTGAGQVGDFEADVAVDPTTTDILVADPANDLIERFDSSGSFLGSFDGSGSPDGVFQGLLDIDVTPTGDIYVVDSQGGPVFQAGKPDGPPPCGPNTYCADKPSRLELFSSSGAYSDTLLSFTESFEGGGVSPTQCCVGLVAFDPSNLQILGGHINPQGPRISAFSSAGDFVTRRTLPNSFTWFPSLAAAAGASARVYAVTDKESQPFLGQDVGEVKVHVLRAANLASVQIDPGITELTSSSAHVSGTVNPNAEPTKWQFQYSSDGMNWFNGPGGDAGSGSSDVEVEGDLSKLQPNTDYFARLTATSNDVTVLSGTQAEFITPAVPPSEVQTIAAGAVTATSALLGGYLNPNNSPSTYYFEYGIDPSYGASVPISEHAAAGSSGSRVKVTQMLTNLKPDTTYHYRILAENPAGTAQGADETLTTAPAEVSFPNRGFELVNTPDKDGQTPVNIFAGFPDVIGPGQTIWSSFSATADATSGIFSSYLATRTPAGWQSRNLLPPLKSQIDEGHLKYGLAGVDASLSNYVFQVGGEAIGSDNTHQAVVRVDAHGAQETLLEIPYKPDGDLPGRAAYGPIRSIVASPNLSHIFVTSTRPLLPGHATGSANVYEVSDGTPELVNRLPDESVPSCGIFTGPREETWGFSGENSAEYLYPYFSTAPEHDGDRIFFESQGNNCNGPSNLYARDLSTQITTLISDPVGGTPGDSRLIRASADGQQAIYVSRSRIGEDDENDSFDIYRWSSGSGSECLTCVVDDAAVLHGNQNRARTEVVSSDLSHVYFTSAAVLVPNQGIVPGKSNEFTNLYVWHDGQIDFVAPTWLFGQKPQLSIIGAETTADGSVLVFASSSPSTADETDGTRQYYRYDESDGSVTCLTCPPPGEVAFDASGAMDNPVQRALSADGETFVFTTKSAILPLDVNKTTDLYEWHNGAHRLITDGVTEWPSSGGEPQLVGISPDATDVIFSLGGSLTGYERDFVANLYDARAGGGIYAPTPEAPCVEDACQGPLETPPSLSNPGSSAFSGPANPAAPRKSKAKKRDRKKRQIKKQRKKGSQGKRRDQNASKGGSR